MCIQDRVRVQDAVIVNPMGTARGSVFGTIKAGDACAEFDSRIRPASRCSWINEAQASLYLRGVLYDFVVMDFDRSFKTILA